MFSYTYRCPAKVNLSLAIIGKDEREGMHFLDTVIAKVDLCDELELRLSRGREVVTSFEWVDEATKDETLDERNNTITKAYELLNTEVGNILPGMAVRVIKRIPSQSGLGGAASDAAGFLRLIRQIMGSTAEFSPALKERLCVIEPKRLGRIGFEVGADVPAFLHDGTVRVRGFGEAVAKINLEGLQDFSALIAVPKVRLGTKEMYAKVKMAERKNHTVDFLCKWYEEGADAALAVAKNDFEEIARELAPEVGETIDTLKSAGFPFVGLTGSGSAVFALYKRGKELEKRGIPGSLRVYRHQILV